MDGLGSRGQFQPVPAGSSQYNGRGFVTALKTRLFTSGPTGEISGSTNEVRSFARSLGRPSSKGRERFAINHLLAHLTKLVGAKVERKGVVEILLGRKRVVEIELGGVMVVNNPSGLLEDLPDGLDGGAVEINLIEAFALLLDRSALEVLGELSHQALERA